MDGSGYTGICEVLISPVPEVCFDGLDNDCDGRVDNGCVCTPGSSISCTTSLPGICSAGTMDCLSDGSGYTGVCVPVTTGVPEVCGNGLDDDCDSVVDNGCVCTPGSTTPCMTSLPGICAAGEATCLSDGSGYGFCVATVTPVAEVCGDGLDNDCDGVVDNGCRCTPGTYIDCDTGIPGVCSEGRMACLMDGSGYTGICEGLVSPTPEVCGDGLDNDCDGDVDNGCTCTPGSTTPCITSLPGVCATGEATCLSDGSGYGFCVSTVGPSAEVCGDGLDNDCDGVVDNGCRCTPGSTASCMTGLSGVCGLGQKDCLMDGSGYGSCYQTVFPTTETCGDGLDNDCDGVVDNGCTCAPGSSIPCVSPLPGICSAGTMACLSDGSGYTGVCVPVTTGVPEVCGNGLDDDCDGTIDNGCVCTPGSITACMTSMPGICAAGEATCLSDGSGYGFCVMTATPTPEVCGDGLDNDCDGRVDNGCTCTPGSTMACITGLPGICADGLQTCHMDGSGYGACYMTATPTAEVCGDGLDNDCDGDVDNGCTCAPGSTTPCVTGLPGICSDGLATCLSDGSGYGFCVGSTGPTPEVCGDGLDNDCDGVVDNGCRCTPGSTASCMTGLFGICALGQKDCLTDGSGYGSCYQITFPYPEVCDDGLDSDCDGQVDCDDADCYGVGGCPIPFSGGCVPGDTKPCVVSGEVGICADGVITCDTSGAFWGSCVQIHFGLDPEDCSDGLDNDCDSATDCSDSDCASDPACIGGTTGCIIGSYQPCSVSAPGVCRDGQQLCVDDGFGNGVWDSCVPDFLPGDLPEDCSFAGDEDCDGLSDCSDPDCVGDPACVSGTTCVPGDINACVVTGMLGLCAQGEQVCDISGTFWGSCVQVNFGTPEDCSSGLDEDCDGTTDCSDADCAGDPACTMPPACVPGAIASCTVSGVLGLCAKGEQVCDVSGTFWGPCTQIWFPGAENCSSTEDEDCDGATSCSDPSCATDPACTSLMCVPGAISGCVVSGEVGLCAAGEQTCDVSGTFWGVCTQVYFGTPEDCSNVLDDDCDGTTDCSDADCAGDPACTTTCTPGSTKSCGYSSVGECVLGTSTCDMTGAWGPCVGAVYPVLENCSDGLDNDCDGWTDLVDPDCGGDPCGTPGATRSCGYSSVGECVLGTQTCEITGIWGPCIGAVYPTDEICSDGLDQNCDGTADEFCTVVTCVWNPSCTPGVDCDRIATPDSGTPVMQGWVRGIMGTVWPWWPWPSPTCLTNPTTGVVTCDFDYQIGSMVTINVQYQEGGIDHWHANCDSYPSCDISTATISYNGVISCTEADADPVTLITVENAEPPAVPTGFNRRYTQSL